MTDSGGGGIRERFVDAVLIARAALDNSPPLEQGLVSINPGLRVYVQECERIQITLARADMDEKRLRGMVFRKNKLATIHTAAALNACWTRFVSCKELMHLLSDSKRNEYTVDADAQLRAAINQVAVPDALLECEQFAFVAALEYMLPYSHRPPDLNGETAFAVANRFKLPEFWVEFFYSTSPSGSSYAKISQSVHKDL